MKRLLPALLVIVGSGALTWSCGDPVVNLPEPLIVTNTSVNDGGFVEDLRPTLVFGFNKPVTLKSISKDTAFTLSAADASEAVVPTLVVGFPDAASSADAWNTVEVKPAEDLAEATKYLITVRADVLVAEDGSKLTSDYLFHFQTQ